MSELALGRALRTQRALRAQRAILEKLISNLGSLRPSQVHNIQEGLNFLANFVECVDFYLENVVRSARSFVEAVILENPFTLRDLNLF